MNDASYLRVREIFLDACQLEGDARLKFLDEACGADQALRSEVESLLGFDFADPGHAAKLGERVLFESGDSSLHLPKQIGSYRILSKLGSGGMGVVYRALQERPERVVALKVMRSGLVAPTLLRRFEFEAQVLARLQHPGVAQIHEVGTASVDGERCPYFVMELVEGDSLIRYLRNQALSLGGKINLLRLICDAVGYAHQQGIIHRDLKPDNIIVCADGRPKILDFGIARSTESDVQATTILTGTDQLIGTLGYMSPEQVSGCRQDIDIRSDVYALGVIAFEMFCGESPFDLRGLTLAQALNTLRHSRAKKLSSVDRKLSGDLETVVAKALDVDKERRYGSAGEFSEDLRRFVDNEPVLARKPTLRYQGKMFAAKHRVVVVAGALVLLSIFLGMGLALSQARRAGEEARIASAINSFINNDILFYANPHSGADRDLTVRAALDHAAEKVKDRFRDQPIVEASVRLTMGTSYLHLSQYESALQHLSIARRLFDANGLSETPRALTNADFLSQALHRLGRIDEALVEQEALLERRKQVFGTDHFEVATSMNNLASLLRDKGQLERAELLYQEAIRIADARKGADAPGTLSMRRNLSEVYSLRGKMDEATTLLQQVIDGRHRLNGPDDLATIAATTSLAKIYMNQEKWSAAEPLLKRSLEIRRARLGPQHSSTLVDIADLASVYRELGRLHEALPLSEEAVASLGEVHGDDHLFVLAARCNHSVLLNMLGRTADAIGTINGVIETARRDLPPDHWHLGVYLIRLGEFQISHGALSDAMATLQEARRILVPALGPQHKWTRKTGDLLAELAYQSE